VSDQPADVVTSAEAGSRPVLTRLRGIPGRTPLRVRLVVALLALVAVGLVVTSTVAAAAVRGYLVNQVDRDLSVGRTGPAGFGRGPDADDSPFEGGRAEWYRAALADFSQFGPVRTTGESDSAPVVTRAQIRQGAKDMEPFTVGSKDGSVQWRVKVTSGFTPDGAAAVSIHAISLKDIASTVHKLMFLEIVVGAAVLLLLGGAGYVVVRSNLKPLVEVEQTAEAIAAGDLSQRVRERDPRTEVGRLSRALNGMLAQIEAAFRSREASETAARASEERMRRFVADASHELRTPLTSIRGFAELYRQGAASSPDGIARVMRRVEDSAAQMGVLVDDLLLLARLDQQRPLERTPVDLVALATDAVHDAQVVAPDRRVTLDVDAGEAAVVLGDDLRLRQVLGNLVGNALSHTPEGTAIEVSVAVGRQAREARLAVRDHGAGLDPADASRIFERFYRADSSRTRAAVGTGLGLSIVAALVAAHGGQVGVDTAPGQGAAFWVRLPLADQAPPPAPAPTPARAAAANG
jgi:two-component system OmpR family sensor kinase